MALMSSSTVVSVGMDDRDGARKGGPNGDDHRDDILAIELHGLAVWTRSGGFMVTGGFEGIFVVPLCSMRKVVQLAFRWMYLYG